MSDFDALIAGGGPAGCATAISLADFEPKLRVCLIDTQATDALRIGETMPPQVKPILDHLGLWSMFAGDGHEPSYRTLSAWGGPQLLSNEFLFHTQQVGWRLDRTRFDAMMLQGAVARVAHVAGKVSKLEFLDGIWSVRLNDGAIHTARAVVDATGRAAVLARLHGLQPQRLDRLVSCFAFFENRDAGARELMIEADRDGWWYTAALPDGRRVIAFMSDADIVRRLDLGQRDRWTHALGDTEHIHAVAAGAEPLESPQFRGAGSQLVSCDAEQSLICVGDAASSFDPVSGQGIVKALRSGVFASYAIADLLERGNSDGLRRYGAFVKAEFAAYRNTLRDYYAQEQRWPDSVFWQRRRDSALRGDQSLTSPLPAAASL